MRVGPDGAATLGGMVAVVDQAEGGLDEDEADDDSAEDGVSVGVDLIGASLALG